MSVLDATTEFIERVVAAEQNEEIDTHRKLGQSILDRLDEALDNLAHLNDSPKIIIIYAGVERISGRDGEFLNDGLRRYFEKLTHASCEASDSIAFLVLGTSGDWFENFTIRFIGEDNREPRERLLKNVCPLERTPRNTWLESALRWRDSPHVDFSIRDWRKVIADAQPHFDALYEAVYGHRLSLCLVAKAAIELEPKDLAAYVERMANKISAKAPRRQAEHVIEIIVDDLRRRYEKKTETPWPEGLTWRTLATLALAPAPTELSTLRYLVFDPRAPFPRGRSSDYSGDAFIGSHHTELLKEDHEALHELLALAEAIGLIFRFLPRSRHMQLAGEPDTEFESREFERFAVHSVVRRLMRRRLGQRPAPFGDSAYFELSGYISGSGSLASFDAGGMRTIDAFADRLVAADPNANEIMAEACGDDHYETPQRIAFREREAARMRTAVHMVRSSIPFIQVLRDEGAPARPGSTPMDEHRRRIIQIIDGVRRAQDKRFDLKPKIDREIEHGVALYADELIWLYNEFGVVCLAQGDAVEARSLLDQAWRIARAEYGEAKGHYWSHYKLLRAYIDLELGDIDRARHGFEQVSEKNPEIDHLLGSRARGLIGVIHHLRDDRIGAREFYDRAISIFRQHDRRRAGSFFLRQRADLSRREGKFDDARSDYDLALAAAAEQPDLYYYATVGKARLALEGPAKDYAEAIRSLDVADLYARQIGLPRLRGEVLLVRASLRASLSEYEIAAKAAYQALAIFAKRQLRLRVVSTLTLLADIHNGAGEPTMAAILAKAARDEGLARRYVIKHEEARSFVTTPIATW